MRAVKFSIVVFFSLILHAGCKKTTTDNVTIKVIEPHYPTITLNGEEIVHLPINGSYTESGAVGKDDQSGATTNLDPISNDVDATTPGLYTVQYLTKNTDGYETTATRYVAVTSVDNPVDYSGTYVRAATGQSVIVTKVDAGVYKVQNPGGASGADGVIVYFVEIAPDTFVCPAQPTEVGSFAVTDIAFSAEGAAWKVVNSGYGTQLRTFEKQ
jgi:hypothetical protein